MTLSKCERGTVSYRVGQNGYVADVIVGTRANGAAVLYDLVNVYQKQIVEAPVTMASPMDSQRRQSASTDSMISQPATAVNPHPPILQSTATNEGGNNNGTNVFDGNPGRDAGLGAGGQTGRVRSGASLLPTLLLAPRRKTKTPPMRAVRKCR